MRHLAKFKHSVSEQLPWISFWFGLKFLLTDILRLWQWGLHLAFLLSFSLPLWLPWTSVSWCGSIKCPVIAIFRGPGGVLRLRGGQHNLSKRDHVLYGQTDLLSGWEWLPMLQCRGWECKHILPHHPMYVSPLPVTENKYSNVVSPSLSAPWSNRGGGGAKLRATHSQPQLYIELPLFRLFAVQTGKGDQSAVTTSCNVPPTAAQTHVWCWPNQPMWPSMTVSTLRQVSHPAMLVHSSCRYGTRKGPILTIWLNSIWASITYQEILIQPLSIACQLKCHTFIKDW